MDEIIKTAKEIMYEAFKQFKGRNKEYVIELIRISAKSIKKSINYDVIEQLIKESIDVLEEIGINSDLYPTALSHLANLYIPIGRYKDSEKLFLKAEEIWLKNKKENSKSYGDTLNGLAILYSQLGRTKEAELLFEKVLKILKSNKMENTRDYGAVVHGMAYLYIRMKRFKEAEPLFHKVLEILELNKMGSTRDYGAVLHGLATLYSKMNKLDESEKRFLQSLQIFELNNMENTRDFGAALHGLTILYCKNMKYSNAYEKSLQAITIINKSIMKVAFGGSAGSGSALKEYTKPIFDLLISILVNHSYVLENRTNNCVHQIIDRKLGELYVSGLKYKLFHHNADVNEKKTHDDLIEELTRVEKFNTLATKKTKEEVETNKLRSEKIRENILRLEARVLGDFHGNDTKEIETDRIFEDDEIIIEYIQYKNWFNNDRSKGYCAVVYNSLKKEDAIFCFIGNEKEIDGSLATLRDKILYTPTALVNEEFEKLKSESIQDEIKSVIEKIIKPIEQYIKNTKHVTICADGELTKLPFELLLKDKIIRYLTSGSDEKWLGITTERNNYNIVMGTSEFGATSGNETEKDRRAGFPMYALPYVENECKLVKKMLDKVDVADIRLNSEFTKNAFMQARPSNILHIATHGFFYEKNITESEHDDKVKDNSKINIREDSIVTYSEIEKQIMARDDAFDRCGLAVYNANGAMKGNEDDQNVLIYGSDIIKKNFVGTKLVVLSACNTGLGDVKNGEGVYGLQRAFFLSGVKTLVVSLWNADDKSTNVLMKKLYEGVTRGKRVDRSLEIAKEYVKTATAKVLFDEWGSTEDISPFADYDDESVPFEHPYFWAGFICIGHGGEIFNKKVVKQYISSLEFCSCNI